MAKTIFVLNGPNLNLLGSREPGIYGRETLIQIAARAEARAKALGFKLDFRQSNSEAELIGWVHAAREEADGLIVNAGAYTHTSIALLDALRAVALPVIEVHLSNIFAREDFRHRSYVAPAAQGVISGFGGQSYELAVDAMARLLGGKSKTKIKKNKK
ncbi:MAG: type II 3-dehydroquinate dehydratase [Alphaproteobacteria bacterium]|nr:type II 3-dehydroquinate dehydratase [Alphaproteobacteria bacterium]